ncbi:MAG: ribonuclease III [Oscillospiraceae bacterium]|nr:ribonuclease III [Oscillospiraceae bacterium]
MQDFFSLSMAPDSIRAISSLGLAHLGDAVYEVMVRSWLCLHGKATGKGLHKAAVSYVKAPAQAQAAARLLPMFTEEEKTVFQRGRNAKVNTIPQNASRSDYMHATALEALFGYLYLNGRTDRLNELFSVIMEGES